MSSLCPHPIYALTAVKELRMSGVSKLFVVFKQLRECNGKSRKRARFLELQMLASFDKPHADHG